MFLYSFRVYTGGRPQQVAVTHYLYQTSYPNIGRPCMAARPKYINTEHRCALSGQSGWAPIDFSCHLKLTSGNTVIMAAVHEASCLRVEHIYDTGQNYGRRLFNTSTKKEVMRFCYSYEPQRGIFTGELEYVRNQRKFKLEWHEVSESIPSYIHCETCDTEEYKRGTMFIGGDRTDRFGEICKEVASILKDIHKPANLLRAALGNENTRRVLDYMHQVEKVLMEAGIF